MNDNSLMAICCLCFTALALAFCGEPDISDALRSRLEPAPFLLPPPDLGDNNASGGQIGK